MKTYKLVLLIYILVSTTNGYAQGLKFRNAELVEERTSYNVFNAQTSTFRNTFDIEFDMQLFPFSEIGYILRIKSELDAKTYNLFYDGRGDNFFKLNEEGKRNLITLRINKQQLLDKRWFHTKLHFDLKNDLITLNIDGQSIQAKDMNIPDAYAPAIVFGKDERLIDVPTFAIKNLVIGNNDEKYTFPLDLCQGNAVYDTQKKEIGHVSNPEWLINDAFYWKYQATFHSRTVAGTNYNPQKDEIYYYNRDSIFIYNVQTQEITKRKFASQCPTALVLGTNFLTPSGNKLYAYEVYNERKNEKQPSVASLNLNTYTWESESYKQLPQQLHHHGSFFNQATNSYVIYGGFGNMRYSNDFFCYDLQSKQWKEAKGITGTHFPRYFTSMGYCAQDSSTYFFGGMGNESGDQAVGRSYYYDLHKLDLRTGRLSKVWEIPWDVPTNIVPVRNMIILGGKDFYTLCNPESLSHSYLRLYRFSIKDGSYKVLGDSIPFYSNRISTNANIYFDAQQRKFIAIVQEFDDDIQSQVRIYTLDYPAITAKELAKHKQPSSSYCLLILIISGIAAIAATIRIILFIRKKRKFEKSQPITETSDKHSEENNLSYTASSIYLFGEFMARDKHNRDITYMFSPQLKQAFCLILQYSTDSGISSRLLSSMLWPDKPENLVKNSRGVTINHLRRIFKEMEGINLIFNEGYFKIAQTPPFYCDYTHCIEIISHENITERGKKLISILTRGKFLAFSDQPVFDTLKNTIENKLEPILQDEIKQSFVQKDYVTVLNLTEALFNIDPLNVESILFQIRSLKKLKPIEEAYLKYQTLTAEYKQTFGKEFPQEFKQI